MKKLPLVTWTGLACCLALSSFTWALGQQRKEEQKSGTVRSETIQRTDTRTRSTVELRRSSLYIGASVRLHAGTGYGKVHEFVFTDDGCVDYVIVLYEKRYVPIPWVVTSFDFRERVLILDIEAERIREIPTFTEIAELSSTEFVQKVKTFHKVDSRTRERSTERKKSGEGRSADGKDSDRPKAKEGKDDRSKPKDEPSKDQPGKSPKKTGSEKKTDGEKKAKDKPDDGKDDEKPKDEKDKKKPDKDKP